MPNKYSREKYEEKILLDINRMLRRDFSDPRLKFVTVTRVELSSDFSYAKVFWDTFDTKTRGDAKSAVESITKQMRFKLGETLKVRSVPTIKFIYDSRYEDEKKITDLIKSGSSSDS